MLFIPFRQFYLSKNTKRCRTIKHHYDLSFAEVTSPRGNPAGGLAALSSREIQLVDQQLRRIGESSLWTNSSVASGIRLVDQQLCRVGESRWWTGSSVPSGIQLVDQQLGRVGGSSLWTSSSVESGDPAGGLAAPSSREIQLVDQQLRRVGRSSWWVSSSVESGDPACGPAQGWCLGGSRYR
jgi:hypothetical protein